MMLLAAISMASGCSMCCSPYDDIYPTFGGKWERTDRYEGRVGSAFNDAGALASTVSEETILEEGSYETVYESADVADLSELEEVHTAELETILHGPENAVVR